MEKKRITFEVSEEFKDIALKHSRGKEYNTISSWITQLMKSDIEGAQLISISKLKDDIQGMILDIKDPEKIWNKASFPPKSEFEKWTNDVVAISNLGNVFLLAYYNGEDGGCWQRSKAFVSGEKVEYWTKNPFSI